MFAEYLIKYRNRIGISQSELGKQLGKRSSNAYIARFEAGSTTPPPPDVFEKLVKILKLSKSEELEFLKQAIKDRLHEKDVWFFDRIKELQEELGESAFFDLIDEDEFKKQGAMLIDKKIREAYRSEEGVSVMLSPEMMQLVEKLAKLPKEERDAKLKGILGLLGG